VTNSHSAISRLTRLFAAANLAGLLLAAIWFRCRWLENIPGVNGDEAWYGVQVIEILRSGRFSLQTPTGNPLNPFFFVPLAALHACFHPSVALLRSVAVAGGIAALAVNWLLCRRVFDRGTAWISTMALALLPINIAYSRFAWDASQSVLATLPVLYCSLAAVRFARRQDRWFAAAIVAQLAAVLVHPTNIFAGAAIAAALLVRLVRRWQSASAAVATAGSSGSAGGTTEQVGPARNAAVLIAAALALIIWGTNLVKTPGPSRLADRLNNPGELLQPAGLPHAAVLYAWLFSGETAYRYLAGSHSWLQRPGMGDGTVGFDVILPWVVLLGAAWLVWRWPKGLNAQPTAVHPHPDPVPAGEGDVMADRALVVTWLLEMAGFLVLAGPRAMAPGEERFAMCMIAPAVVLAARGAAVAGTRLRRARPAVLVAAILVGWFVLADFHEHYFRFIECSGGQAHRTFRTAAVEPKQAALDYVLQHRRPGAAWIVTDQWWSYWPLRYLGTDDQDLRVVRPEEAQSLEGFSAARAEGRVWYVEFAGSEELDAARAAMSDCTAHEEQFFDYGGRPVLVVLQCKP
jgi:hypothetical protein